MNGISTSIHVSTYTAAVSSLKKSSWPRILLALFSRLALFAGWQALIALVFVGLGSRQPWQASIAWWPWTAVFANLVCLVLLAGLLKQEGGRLRDLYRLERKTWKKDALVCLALSAVSLPLSYLPNLAFGNLLFGDVQIAFQMLFQPLAIWELAPAMLFMPVTHALTELPTYFGYAMPRIEALTGRRWLAVLVPAILLAAQHITLPLIPDSRFIAWRFLMFLPFALMTGIVLRWRPRLMPFMLIGHALMDFMTLTSFFFFG